MGEVIGGRFRMRNFDAFNESFLKWPDGDVWVLFESAHVLRSTGQNKYWHANVVRPLAAHSRVAPRAMHEALKIRLLPEVVVIPGADGTTPLDTITIGGSTATLTRHEAANVIDRGVAIVLACGLTLGETAPITHFIPWDAPPIGRQRRALCGALTRPGEHNAHPTCRECIERLADDTGPA